MTKIPISSLLMKTLVKALLISLMAAMPVPVIAQSDDVLEMSIDDNIATPEVPRKAKQYVAAAMDQLRRHMIKNKYTVESLRDGEVIEITIPCAELFAPGEVELKANAAELLRPFGLVVREPQKYKVLVAVHTDDTGDDMYSDSISAARANAVDDCLWQIAGERDTNVIPYGIGKDEPRVSNATRPGRAQNRRVEIFIIPDYGLLEMAGVKRKKND